MADPSSYGILARTFLRDDDNGDTQVIPTITTPSPPPYSPAVSPPISPEKEEFGDDFLDEIKEEEEGGLSYPYTPVELPEEFTPVFSYLPKRVFHLILRGDPHLNFSLYSITKEPIRGPCTVVVVIKRWIPSGKYTEWKGGRWMVGQSKIQIPNEHGDGGGYGVSRFHISLKIKESRNLLNTAKRGGSWKVPSIVKLTASLCSDSDKSGVECITATNRLVLAFLK